MQHHSVPHFTLSLVPMHHPDDEKRTLLGMTPCCADYCPAMSGVSARLLALWRQAVAVDGYFIVRASARQWTKDSRSAVGRSDLLLRSLHRRQLPQLSMGVFVNTLIISTFPAKLYTTYPGEFQPAEASVGDVRIKCSSDTTQFNSNLENS